MTSPLVLPPDHLEACRVLCDALTALGPVEDGDGLVADRVRDAHRLLQSALSGVQSCLPRRGDDWQTVVTPSGNVRWVHVNDQGDHGCASCARLPGSNGQPFYEPTERLPSGGYRTLCQWCRKEANANQAEWERDHPDQEPPSAVDAFWPPVRMVDDRRRQGHGRFTEAQRASYKRFPGFPKAKKSKQRRSA